ncbi:MAG: hypothetical protein ACRC0X_01895 [Brevinema sp.]
MYKIIVFFIILGACSVQEKSPRSNQNPSYPFFDILFKGFEVFNQDSNDPEATAQDHINARILTINEKKIMLEALDTVRFIVNTPEFATLMKQKEYYAGANFSGVNGIVQQGEVYPNKDRLLNVIRMRKAGVVISKQKIDFEAFALGQLPVDTSGRFFNAYVDADDHPFNQETFFIAFNNRQKWDDPIFFEDEGFIAGVVFHELLHNMGFVHSEDLDFTKDTVYMLQEVLETLYNNLEWQNKYRTQLAYFRPFYPIINNEWLREDTLPQISRFMQKDMLEYDALGLAYDGALVYRSKHGVAIKCIYDKKNKQFIMQIYTK